LIGRYLNIVIDYIVSTNSFSQHFVLLKYRESEKCVYISYEESLCYYFMIYIVKSVQY